MKQKKSLTVMGQRAMKSRENKNQVNTTIYLFAAQKTYETSSKGETRSKRKGMPADNTVLIGKKPVMNYVLACITFFHGGAKEVNIKARGQSISRAIDVAEVVRRRFLPDVKVKRVGIGTDQVMPREEGSQLANVSSIEITLER
jgi:archaea-specific DNA-binding protein